MLYELPVNYDKLKPHERKTVREQYIKEQKGNCYWCNHPLDGKPPVEITNTFVNWKLFPPGFRRNPVHLQHNHDTGMTEGAVHAYCNAVMWQYHGK